MIPVTKPFLPPVEKYQSIVQQIWERQWLTNNGPLVNELELKLKKHLGLEHLLYLSNGTIALQIAIKALNLKGEVITTPFSYVATTSSIVWEGCIPVFVDIDEASLNINPQKIEDAITEKTTAILATHVYGNPCDIEEITSIARKHNLRVIYDAAHCFGSTYKGKSVLSYGDISTCSFHATKIYHTIEGGGVFTTDPELLKKMAYHRNFGHETSESFGDLGINGKNSEFHAAMGIINLEYMDEILRRRAAQRAQYAKNLSDLDHRVPVIIKEAVSNFAYLPIIFRSEEALIKSVEMLNNNWIYPRRYFYPSLDTLPYVKEADVPVAKSVASRVLCLPLFHNLSDEEIDYICRLLLRAQNN